MLTIAARAAEERAVLNISPFRYTIILTKTDKIDPKSLHTVVESVRSAVVDSMPSVCSIGGDSGKDENVSFTARAKRAAYNKKLLDGVSIIPTSSVSRAGAEQLWELIYNSVVDVVVSD